MPNLGPTPTDENPTITVEQRDHSRNVLGMWQIKTSDFTAVKGGRYQVDCSVAPVTMTLPVGLGEGDLIEAEDAALSWSENNFTVALAASGFGSKINGINSPLVVERDGDYISLVAINKAHGVSAKSISSYYLASVEYVDYELFAHDAPFHAGSKTGSFVLDYTNGSTQLVQATGNITIAAPSNVSEGRPLTIVLTTTEALTLDFSDVQMSPAAEALLPISLDNEKVYVIDLIFAGYYWVLKSITAASNINSVLPPELTVVYNGTDIVADSYTTHTWANWFHSNTEITSIVFGSILTKIGHQSFYGCSGLTGALVIPDSVTEIGQRAFRECTGYTSLSMPSGLVSIENGTFRGCSGLTGSVTLPPNVTRLGWNVFRNCSGLTGSLTLNSVIEYIDLGCFRNAGFTGTLVLPISLTHIGNSLLKDTPGITRLDCYCALTAMDTNTLNDSGVTEIHARAADSSWTAGIGLTISGKAGITVTKDL